MTTLNDLLALLADNTAGDISAADMRTVTTELWNVATAEVLSGAGSPEGVVVAPVGAVYADTAATLGAVLWVKATGAGNTGWRVIYGDTGQRNPIAWSAAGAYTVGGPLPSTDWAPSGVLAGGIYLRRIGSTVSVVVEGIKSTVTSPNGPVYTMPIGFRPSRTVRVEVSLWPGSILGALSFPLSGVIARGGNASWAANLYTVAASPSWVTADPWPTVLP